VTLTLFSDCPVPLEGLDHKPLSLLLLHDPAPDYYLGPLVLQLPLVLGVVYAVPHYHRLSALSQQLRGHAAVREFLVQVPCQLCEIVDWENVLN
jgi:hypothetical protein